MRSHGWSHFYRAGERQDADAEYRRREAQEALDYARAVERDATAIRSWGRPKAPLDFRRRSGIVAFMTTREIDNRISGVKTQLKRHAGGRREQELRRRLEALEQARDDAPLLAELEKIDAAWETTVQAAADALYGRPGDHKVETALRNGQARKRAARGLEALETVANEMRRLAEDDLLDLLRRRQADPRAASIQARLDRGEELRRELERRTDQRSGIFAEAA